MAERKMRYAVLTLFEKSSPIGNKARYQWDADNLLESYSFDEIKLVMAYFFSVSRTKSWSDFVYKFDEYRDALIMTEKDNEQRKRNRERIKEWLA